MKNNYEQKLLYNAKVVTADRNFTIAQAVLIQNGIVGNVGSIEKVRSFADRNTGEIDLDGKTVVPGFIDSHDHMLWTALEKRKVSVAGAKSITELLDIIRKNCERVGPGNWVETSQVGFEPKQLRENRSPNRWELDAVAPNNPVIHEEHFHYSVVNSYVLNLLNITKDSPDPPGGLIAKDPASGEPTGWLGDTALEMAKALIPPPTYEEKIMLLKSTMIDFNSLGITSIVDPWLTLDEIKIYRELCEKDMTIRVKALLSIPPLMGGLTGEEIELGSEAISNRLGLGQCDRDMLRIDGLKTMLDTGVHGTYFRDPYMLIPGEQEDPEWRGWLTMPREEFKELCLLAARAGWRLCVHCAGDAAMDILLDVFREVNKAIPIVEKHWVIIHGQIPRPEHFPLIKKLGLRVACQSVHTYTMGADFVKWWGFNRAAYSDPIKTYLDNNIPVGGGSDAYFCEWNPCIQVWFDITRQSKWAGILGQEQRITREQSLTYHTINSALISGDDSKLGSIEQGKFADLVVLSDDLLTCPTAAVKDIKVEMTMVQGDVVYQR
jgi:predicted amidohydrolase YtcJ